MIIKIYPLCGQTIKDLFTMSILLAANHDNKEVLKKLLKKYGKDKTVRIEILP